MGRGYVYAEMVLQQLQPGALQLPACPRLQLCQLLPPAALQFRHLYLPRLDPMQPFCDSLAGLLLLLPGPRCGELVLDRREGVEWRPMSLSNAFGDRFHVVCRGTLLLTDLRVLFLPFELTAAPWVEPVRVSATAADDGSLTEASLATFRRATFQAPLGTLQDVRSVPAPEALSQACTLLLETRDGIVTEFLVKKSVQSPAQAQAIGRGSVEKNVLYLAGLDADKVAPAVWCARFTDNALGLVREDRAWLLWAAYLRQSVDDGRDGVPSSGDWAAVYRQARQPVSLEADYQRMRVVEGGMWRFADNNRYSLCQSYPQTLCLPGSLDEDDMAAAASQRSKGRLASLVWLHPHTKAPLCRAAQPMAGVSGFDTKADRKACLAIRHASLSGLPLRIADARPRLNANANALQGKGFESVSALGGAGVASLVFLDVENIHEMRRSLGRLREGIVPGAATATSSSSSSSGFGTGYGASGGGAGEADCLVASKWLTHVASLLRASACVSESLLMGHPVLTHCSDGWDRTSQISALAQLLLDPFYRTCEGLLLLVHKDFCAFGHRFHDRCNGRGGPKESSPVFLQFLDCVFQVQQQHPCACEFSPTLLLLLAQASASGAFSTFRENSERERFLALRRASSSSLEELGPEDLPCSSVFCYLQLLLRGPVAALLLNPHYAPPPPAQRLCLYLRPRCGPQDMVLWRAGLCGVFPSGLGAAGAEGPTAAESAAHALRSGAAVDAYLAGLRRVADPAVQRRVSALLEQSLPHQPSLLEAPSLAVLLAAPALRPVPPRPAPCRLARNFPRAACRLQLWVRACLQSRRAAKLLAPPLLPPARLASLRRCLLTLALAELKSQRWALSLAAEAAWRFVRLDVLGAVVEAALEQCARTEHAEGFLDGPALQTALALADDGRSSHDAPSLLDRMRKLAGTADGYSSCNNSSSERGSGVPPVMFVPPLFSHGSLAQQPDAWHAPYYEQGHGQSSPGKKESPNHNPNPNPKSVFRSALNYVQGKG